MSIWHVTGAGPLRGSIRVQGSKNAVLPVIAASLLCPNETELLNCPRLSDVDAAADILRYLGCSAEQNGDVLYISTRNPDRCDIPRELMHKMRSSVLFLGPMLARFGEARISVPGGCELGKRPVDLHLRALESLGAEIRQEDDAIVCCAGKLHGAEISLAFPSVGATENVGGDFGVGGIIAFGGIGGLRQFCQTGDGNVDEFRSQHLAGLVIVDGAADEPVRGMSHHSETLALQDARLDEGVDQW